MKSDWTWKARQGGHGDLLYEPGNWGDLLKAAWVVRVAKWLVDARGPDGFGYADPFAGAPVYPLCAQTKIRLDRIGDAKLSTHCAEFVDAGVWPAAAMLVARVCAEVPAGRIMVFDTHLPRQEALAACGRFSLLQGAHDGWEFVRGSMIRETSLVLIDPYDFLQDWRARLEPVLRLARASSVMLYIYNRSARGRERLRDYRDFINALDAGLGSREKYLARVPGDAFLPTAHHEMLFIPGDGVAGASGFTDLVDDLGRCAMRIAAAIDARAVVEW